MVVTSLPSQLETLDKANDALSKVKDVVGESCALVDKVGLTIRTGHIYRILSYAFLASG